jgi:hypothetical protein
VEHVGPNAYQKPDDRGGLERTNDVVFANDAEPLRRRHGELHGDFSMPSPSFQTPKSSVIRNVTDTGAERPAPASRRALHGDRPGGRTEPSGEETRLHG